MTSDGSVTGWLGKLQDGDSAAVERLWAIYFRRLVGLARTQLRNAPRRVADEEDVALSAFDSFCRQAEQGRFPQLADRDGLWRLLVVMTARKAAHLKRDETRLKRGGGASPQAGPPDDPDALLEQALSTEPTPELAAEVADECRRLLQKLGDPELATVALRRMEGHSVEEIAEQLGYAPRSIKRKLQLIRGIWEGDAPA